MSAIDLEGCLLIEIIQATGFGDCLLNRIVQSIDFGVCLFIGNCPDNRIRRPSVD